MEGKDTKGNVIFKLGEAGNRIIRNGTEMEISDSQTQDLGVKTALFAVLVWSRKPAILFEASFVSNPEDELRLRMPLYQQTLAEAMADGIEAWYDEQGR